MIPSKETDILYVIPVQSLDTLEWSFSISANLKHGTNEKETTVTLIIWAECELSRFPMKYSTLLEMI